MVMRWVLFLGAIMSSSSDLVADEAWVWIGTQGGESRGVYRATLNLDSGDLSQPKLAAELPSPGFVAVHPNGQRLYSLFRLPNREGGVAVFEIDSQEGTLRPLNRQPIGDGGASHLAVDHSGRCLFTAQYGAGSVAVFPLDEEGRIQSRSCLVKHEGSGPNPERQQQPHPHWVGVDGGNRFLFVPDLGTDQIVIYRLDLEAGRIERHGHGRAPAGGGPRHMKFHPQANFAFVVNELQMSVTSFAYDPDAGTLEALQTISTLPEELQEVPNKASEIRIHPSGQFVYAANRGHDSIAVFRVDSNSGKLTFVEREAIRGSWPRNFNLDPTGKWLLAAGRNSNTVSVFRVDSQTGGLTFTGRTVNCPTPICVEFQSK
jgi:6-phosphogluconolactonase